MSDPSSRDPRFDPIVPPEEDARSRRLAELNTSNAMWGWIAGAVVLALVLIFVFARVNVTDTASNPASPRTSTTGMAPPNQPAPPATTQAPRPAPSTTGQGTAR
jgi:hypothetical protein